MATILTQQKAQPIIHEINLELFDFTNKKKFQFIRGKNGLELIVDFAPLTTIKRGKIPIEGKGICNSITEKKYYGVQKNEERYIPITTLSELALEFEPSILKMVFRTRYS